MATFFENFTEYEHFPLPPPWINSINENGEVEFYNHRTGEISSIHPFEAYKKKYSMKSSSTEATPSTDAEAAPSVDTETVKNGIQSSKILDLSLNGATIRNKNNKSKSINNFVDFRCQWKESGLHGNINSYGLILRYFEDQSTQIKFDGVEGEWLLTALEGPYGPMDRYDLFIGAKVKGNIVFFHT